MKMKITQTLTAFLLFYVAVLSAQTGKALDFDGSNDRVSASVPTALNDPQTQDFTIEMWVKPRNFTTQRLIFAQNSTTNLVSIMLNNQGKVYFYVVRPGANSGVASSVQLVGNTWSHVAVTWNAASSTSKIYINGVEALTTAGGSSSTGTSGTMTIGSRTDGVQAFNGVIDELRIWNTVRTATQISSLQNSELSLPQTNLQTYYRFNQGIANGSNPTVTTLTDELTTNNGTLLNFDLNGTTSNWIGDSVMATEEFADNSSPFSIAPNPAQDEITVSGLKSDLRYQIFDAAGRTVLRGELRKADQKINVSSLRKGLFFIQIGNDKQKLLKD